MNIVQQIAKRTDISRYITFNEQEGAQASSVLAKTVNAVIAVVFFDCGGDIGVVLKTMRHLGFVTPTLLATACSHQFSMFTSADQSVNPELLSLEEKTRTRSEQGGWSVGSNTLVMLDHCSLTFRKEGVNIDSDCLVRKPRS